MRTTGLRGKYSPMNRATSEQKATILDIVDNLRSSGTVRLLEVRYVAYIGPDTPDAIAVIVDGMIYGYVYKDGTVI